MSDQTKHAPGEPAPAAGVYEQINIFRRRTGIRIDVSHGDPFPLVPIGHTWRLLEENGADC